VGREKEEKGKSISSSSPIKTLYPYKTVILRELR
jgi:hypothetical protein